MSRRRAATKRDILPDHKFNSEMLAKFINYVMVQGKKSIAENIVYNALDVVAANIKEEKPLVVFEQTIDKLQPMVEVKSRRIGGASYLVPNEVRSSRRMSLAMRWLVDAAKKRSEKTMQLRLGNEIVAAFNGSGIAIKKKEETHRVAASNRAFAHVKV